MRIDLKFPWNQIHPRHVWCKVSVDIRRTFINEELFVPHPDLVKALKAIRHRLRLVLRTGAHQALLILCPSGGGKSHLVRLLKRMLPDEESPEVTYQRVVSFKIPSRPDATSMAEVALNSLGHKVWDKRKKADKLTEDLVGFLADVGTWIVAIDDFQDIPERRQTRGILQVGNWTRDFIDLPKSLVVMLGTPAALEVVQSNPQLRRRGPGVLSMDYFGINTAAALSRLKRFLEEVDMRLPLAESSDLSSFAKKIYWATYGIQDYIFLLLGEAVEFAVEAGRERIEEPDLAGAFNTIFLDAAESINPFKAGGPQRPLDEPGEPFENWFSGTNSKAHLA